MNGLLITGLLAVLGTVIGSVIKARQETKSADKKFQSDLILRALESNNTEARIDSLQFLINTNLISDQEIREGIAQVIPKPHEWNLKIPQFTQVGFIQPVNPVNPVNPVVPTDDHFALVALKVRSGSIIDAITPVFAEVTPDLKLINRKDGQQVGGKGGTEKLLEQKERYIITGIDVVRGSYFDFDRDEVVHIQVFWHKLTPQGIDPTAKIASEKLGAGNHVKSLKPLEKLRVKSGYYISDLTLSYSHRTGGENYINNIVIKQSKLPIVLPNQK
ncbi:MAG: hypothetical protein DRQ49_12105 [Gammaproteobacteria bacterium]|nr:MAG: hypothetical protein DRQ49_12105 [Gammaproteobacteria bacterium]RKZ73788.1 MAG: hypothetical protein DRQ57_13280 [Gammaproteobacteria bacterium]